VTRRELIRSASLFAASAAAVFPAKEVLKSGIETNAWKTDLEDFGSLVKVLEQISSLGFDGFETSYRNVQAAFGGKRAKEAKAQIAATGVRFLGCHIFQGNYDAKTNIAPIELIEEIADGAASLGAERLILSGSPVADEGAAMDEQRLQWKAGALNRAGRHCYELKLRVCYRNHGPEFAKGGEEILALMRETDPDNVHFIVDAAYAIAEKTDLAGLFTKYHKRIDGFHLRDFNKEQKQVALGQGELQYEPLAIAIRKLKWTGWVIAEELSEAATRPAREQIRKLFGV
jgi:sugar phosphate isomerase/epimerase